MLSQELNAECEFIKGQLQNDYDQILTALLFIIIKLEVKELKFLLLFVKLITKIEQRTCSDKAYSVTRAVAL